MTGFLEAINKTKERIHDEMKVSELLDLAFDFHSTDAYFKWEGWKGQMSEITGACTLGAMSLLLGIGNIRGADALYRILHYHPRGIEIGQASMALCTSPELEAGFLEAFSGYPTVSDLRAAVRRIGLT